MRMSKGARVCLSTLYTNNYQMKTFQIFKASKSMP